MKKILKIILYFNLLFPQSPEQLNQAKRFIKANGISEQEAIREAKNRGYSQKEIETVLKEKKSNKANKSKETIDFNKNSTDELAKEEKDIKDDKVIEALEMEVVDEIKENSEINTKLNYFGYDIFERDPAIFQATSVGAMDPNYLIGPKDEIIVMLWGETQFREVFSVNREGFIFIPEIGQVFVNGLNLTLLESKLFKVFSQSYASLNPQGRAPTTFLDISLGNLRPLRIQVLGEVAQPGAYTVSPSSTLFSSLYYFNGPTTFGSLRDIHLIRGGEKIASIDFYDYLLTGKKPNDQKLQLDDVIFIPKRLKTISIDGEINRGGIYELKAEENLTDLIKVAGQLKITAFLNNAQIDRIVPFKDRKKLGMDRIYKNINLEEVILGNTNFKLYEGDEVQIFSIFESRMNFAEINGAVSRPGSYDLGDSLKLSELIAKADGLLSDVYMDRIDIFRTNSDLNEELIKLDLKSVLENSPESDLTLMGKDVIRVYGKSDMSIEDYVFINGHVKNPGRYLLKENMTILDLLFYGGGYWDEEFKNQTYLDRADLIRLNDNQVNSTLSKFKLEDVLDSTNLKNNFLLKPGDKINIYKNDVFVSEKPLFIDGSVKNKGSYIYKNDMTLKDLILQAGGLNNDVYNYKVEIARIDPYNQDWEEFAVIDTFYVDHRNFNKNVSDNLENKRFSSKVDSYTLQPYDRVSIRKDPLYQRQKQINISGEVSYPGGYTITNSNEKITDIIDRAGGLLYNAYPEGSQYIRGGKKIRVPFEKIIKNPNSNLNFKVQNKDSIKIVGQPNIIILDGEINTPGVHKFTPNKRVRFYLKSVGGYTPEADGQNIWVEYPNGDSKKYNRYNIFGGPKVIDGSTIKVGKLKETEPFDRTEFAKEVTTIIANLAQAMTLIMLYRG